MDTAQAIAISIACLESCISEEIKKTEPDKGIIKEMRNSILIMKGLSKQGEIEYKKRRARKLLSDTNLSYREIGRQVGLCRHTVSKVARELWA